VNTTFSFRRRLITLYVGSVIPLIILLGVVVHFEYRAFLIAEHQTTLHDLLRALVSPVYARTPDSLTRLAEVVDTQLRGTDFHAIVLDSQGQPIQADGRSIWLSAADHATLRTNQQPIMRTISGADGSYQVVALAIPGAAGQASGSIEGSFALHVINPDLMRLTQWLALTIVIALVCVLGLAPLVARRATQPLTGIVQTTQAASQGDLSVRADLPNVTELRDVAQTLNALLDTVQQTLDNEIRTTEVLRRFAADASHELRSPLAVIGNGLEVLEESLQRGDAAQAHQIIGQLAREQGVMHRLVGDLLLLARMEQPNPQRTQLQHEPIEPFPLLEEVAERGRTLAHGQEIRLRWPQQLPPTIMGDTDALRRALNNLVENALRHTPAGRAVQLHVEAADDGCLFTIADEGSGVAAEHLPHLGKRFYRVDQARGRTEGTGLGLAIVRAITDAHGGTITFASAPGAGFVAKLWLPSQVAASANSIMQQRIGAPTLASSPQAHQPQRRTNWGRTSLIGLAGGILILIGMFWWTGDRFAAALPTASPEAIGALSEATATDPVPTASLVPTAPPATITPNAPATPPVAHNSEAGPFERAAQLAVAAYGGIALEVEVEGSRDLIEVTLSDGSEVVVDLSQAQLVAFAPGPQGQGRGVERQRLRRAELAAAIVQAEARIGFDQASRRPGIAAPVAEIELTWEDGALWYAVEFTNEQTWLVHAITGAVRPYDD
jgi:two-component system OmpR family sensor kinase